MSENKIILADILMVMLLGIGYSLVDNTLMLGMLKVRDEIRYLLDNEIPIIYKTDISDYSYASLSTLNEKRIIFKTNIVTDDVTLAYINPVLNKIAYTEHITTIYVRKKSCAKR